MRSKKLMVAFLALALATLGLVACGGDDDEGADPNAEQAQPEPEQQVDAEGEGGTIQVVADPGGQLRYTTGELETEAGTVTIEFDNPSTVPHDVRIENEDGEDFGGTEVITGDEATASVDLEPGSYTYYCSVSGHREAGMEDPLEVR